jgi:hypothetical protein
MQAPIPRQPPCKAHWLNNGTLVPLTPIATLVRSVCRADTSQTFSACRILHTIRAMRLRLQVRRWEQLHALQNLPEAKLGLSLRRRFREFHRPRDPAMSLGAGKVPRSTTIRDAIPMRIQSPAANTPPNPAFQPANDVWMMVLQWENMVESQPNFQ